MKKLKEMGPFGWLIMSIIGGAIVSILLFTLKLAGIIALSLWWVFGPIAVPLVACILLIIALADGMSQ